MIYMLFLFLFSFLTSMGLCHILRIAALKTGRLQSLQGVPLIGGISFMISFSLCFLLFYFFLAGPQRNVRIEVIDVKLLWIIFFSLFFLVIEFLDDIKDFSLKIKLIVQVITISIFLSQAKTIQIYFIPGWANWLLSFVWIMGISNAFNHLDIADGLCGGVALVAGVSFLTVSFLKGLPLLTGVCTALVGALLPFVILNFPPAKVYMGNSGSHSIGFLFAALSMYADYATLENPFALLFPLCILAFPVLDTLFVVVARIKKGIIPLKKSNDHMFLRLCRNDTNTTKTLLFIWSVSFLWGLSGVFIVFGAKSLFLITAAAAAGCTVKLILRAHSLRA